MAVAVPLSGWADRQVRALQAVTGAAAIGRLRGTDLLAARARFDGFRVPGRVSAGGGCRFYETRDDAVALNLSRPDDHAMLPALFGDAMVDGEDEARIAARFTSAEVGPLVAQGRALGLAIAALAGDGTTAPACTVGSKSSSGAVRAATSSPLVIDLSALWAGPLASHLLHLCGADVVKVESRTRSDAMRDGDPAFFAALNDGKDRRAIDLLDPAGRAALLALIRRADVVIEAARPRALLQLGIDADALVGEVPGLVWATITAHGVAGEASNWVGFGDDTGVAGGLSAALHGATGKTAFVGDAIGDPLTGVFAARKIAEYRASGQGARLFVSMAGVAAEALAEQRADDEAGLVRSLEDWAASEGQAFGTC